MLRIAGEDGDENGLIKNSNVAVNPALSEMMQKVRAAEETLKEALNNESEAINAVRLKATKITELSRSENKRMLYVSWDSVKGAEGYEIEYADNSFFSGSTVVTSEVTSTTLRKLNKKKEYYIRIRAFSTAGADTGVRIYSDYAYSENVSGTKTGKYSFVRRTVTVKKKAEKDEKTEIEKEKVKVKVELRSLTHQKMTYNDTVQGSASDGVYNYYALYDRIRNRCRVAKVRASDMKVMRVSKNLPLYHGNGMAYDPVRKRLVAVTAEKNVMNVIVINPKTLKVSRTVKITMPNSLYGMMNNGKLSKVCGFTAVAYDSENDRYIFKLLTMDYFLVTNGDFRPIRGCHFAKTYSETEQSIAWGNGLVLRARSGSNIITAYDMYGNAIAATRINISGELESIYFVGDELYGSVYRSYYTKKTITVTKKVKKKYKKHGKTRYKWVKKKVKKQVSVLHRDNYVIKINEY